ncbi:hypothetical protein HYY69_03340 [Candidatus Woesearchaeota archaeon]|nr:hypothetical protein [Candidatus Woesearchaeota archaeon]
MNKTIVTILSLIVVLAIIVTILLQKNDNDSDVNLKQVNSISHIHGIAVDKEDSSKLYIATHHGLYVLINDTGLYKIGESEDDFMGFSLDPKNANVFYRSGHPESGGNLGFQRSDDQGHTWKKISDGVNGPVDFHVMVVHPANPNSISGWYNGALQQSNDQGKAWNLLKANLPLVFVLAGDPINESRIYAGTVDGLMVSDDKGYSWVSASEQFQNNMVVALAIHTKDPNIMLSFSKLLGLAKSTDGGKTWKKNSLFDNDIVLHITFDSNNPGIVYLATKDNSIYKSLDTGNTWKKIR